MTASRIGAVLAAVVLIAAAFLVRRNVLDDDEESISSGGSVAVTTALSTPAAAVVCSTELAAACEAIEAEHPELSVDVEPAGTTLDDLAVLADGEEVPVWLTVAPFPAMVDSLRDVNGLAPLGMTSDVIAESQLVVATPADGRAEVLANGCAEAPLWRCLGEVASKEWTEMDGGDAEWGTVRPSLGRVEREATALGSFAAAVSGYLGGAEITQTALGDPAFIAWLRQLAHAVDPSALSGGSPLNTMVIRPSALDVAATTTAEQSALGANSARYDASYPEPSMWLEAVLAVPDGAAVPDDLGDVAAGALAGWDAPSTETQSLPSATTMLALRTLWEQAT